MRENILNARKKEIHWEGLLNQLQQMFLWVWENQSSVH